ncbi:putative uncharacterized protein DDB_G0286901 [Carica papaya]|uniref:putative uncharacterized protein DDB_G0286901 n=1 Tax=Carica papaya TaxID=3649 RepID=UPI000B8CCF87|nr:putative uncharacterized protein DDB_G0286901 [Carica papaya]
MDKEESIEKNNKKIAKKRNLENFYWPKKFVTATLTPTTLTLAPNTFKIWKQEKFNLESHGSTAKESNNSKTNPTSQSSDANIISTVGNQVNAGGFSQPLSFDGNINEVGDDGNGCCGKNFENFEPLASNSNININPRRHKRSNQVNLNQQQQEIGSLNQVNKNQLQTIRPDIDELQQQQTIRPNADILKQVSMNQQEGTTGHAFNQLEHVKINQQHQIVGPDIFGLNQDSASQQKMIGSNISNQVNGYRMQQTIATNDYRLNEVWMNHQQREMIAPNCLDKAIGLQVNIGEMPNNTLLSLDQSILNNAANLNMMRNRLSKLENMVNLMTMNKKHEYGSNNNTNISFNNNQPGISSSDACRSTNMSFDDQLGIAFSDFFWFRQH